MLLNDTVWLLLTSFRLERLIQSPFAYSLLMTGRWGEKDSHWSHQRLRVWSRCESALFSFFYIFKNKILSLTLAAHTPHSHASPGAHEGLWGASNDHFFSTWSCEWGVMVVTRVQMLHGMLGLLLHFASTKGSISWHQAFQAGRCCCCGIWSTDQLLQADVSALNP